MSDYRILPVEPSLSGLSGEANQILLDGIVRRVTLFHGTFNEELDWHVYFRPSSDVVTKLGRFLRQRDYDVADQQILDAYSELMLVDRRGRRGLTVRPWESFQWKYNTADLTPVLLLWGQSDHPAYHLGRQAADNPGRNRDLLGASRLIGARVYMQGLPVLDVGHTPNGFEIHPPDSIAFAMNADGRALSARPGDDDWPDDTVRWRVAWFANSSYHRVADERPLQQPRTTTWHLDQPGAPSSGGRPGQLRRPVQVRTHNVRLWDSNAGEWYESRGVASIDEARVDRERGVVVVSATMRVAGTRGGIVVRDYVIRAVPPVIQSG